MVTRQSFAHGRRVAIWTSLGIGLGILVHVTYSLLGIGILIAQSLTLFTIVKICGAIYLAFIGVKSLRARPHAEAELSVIARIPPPRRKALVVGFLTNVLNPKATLFFLAIFSTVLDPRTPVVWLVAYGIWMSLATMTWFTGVSLLFTHQSVKREFSRVAHWIERAMGAALIALGVKLAISAR